MLTLIQLAVIGEDDKIAFRAKKIHALDIDRQDRVFALVGYFE